MRIDWQGLWKSEVLARLAADVLMVNLCFLSAFFIRYVGFRFWQQGIDEAFATFQSHLNQFFLNFISLTIISVVIFASNGFYTQNRAYRSRFKLLIIAQAVTLSYLVFGFLEYLWPQPVLFPRTVLLLGWGITLLMLWASRLWSGFWKRLALKEYKLNAEPNHPDPKQILVIGGAGYIGSALLPQLLEQGYHVRLLDLFVYGRQPIEPYINHSNLEIINADFRQIDKVVEAVKGVHSVIHLGAIVGDPACALDEELTKEVNLAATRMIGQICKGYGIQRFIFASTCSVYGCNEQMLDERSRLNPVSLYAKTKIACEKTLQKMEDEHFSPVILRFSTVFGLSGRTRFDLVVNLLTAKACFEGKVTLYGGDQWRPFVHVDDAARAVAATRRAPQAAIKNQVFNVGGDWLNCTLSDVGYLIAQSVCHTEVIEYGNNEDSRNYRVDFSKIRNHLNFVPQHTLQYGINQVLQAIEQGQVLDYKHPQYNNARYLQEEISASWMCSRYIEGSTEQLMEVATT